MAPTSLRNAGDDRLFGGDGLDLLKQAFANEGVKITIKPTEYDLKTPWLTHRSNSVPVEQIYSASKGKERLQPMRDWLELVKDL